MVKRAWRPAAFPTDADPEGEGEPAGLDGDDEGLELPRSDDPAAAGKRANKDKKAKGGGFGARHRPVLARLVHYRAFSGIFSTLFPISLSLLN